MDHLGNWTCDLSRRSIIAWLACYHCVTELAVFVYFLTSPRGRAWECEIILHNGGRRNRFSKLESLLSQFHQSILHSTSSFWKTLSWVQNILGRWLDLLLSSPWLPQFILFPPSKRRFILEADELVHLISLRICPCKFSCKAQEKWYHWEETKHRFQWNSSLLEQVFLSRWNLSDSLYMFLLFRQMDRQKNKETEPCLFWSKHFFDKVQLSARLNYLKNHSHLVCLLHPSLLNTS